jgi:putative transposase
MIKQRTTVEYLGIDLLPGKDAKMQIAAGQQEYNENRPHRALGEIAPAEFACEHWLKWESRRENTVWD